MNEVGKRKIKMCDIVITAGLIALILTSFFRLGCFIKTGGIVTPTLVKYENAEDVEIQNMSIDEIEMVKIEGRKLKSASGNIATIVVASFDLLIIQLAWMSLTRKIKELNIAENSKESRQVNDIRLRSKLKIQIGALLYIVVLLLPMYVCVDYYTRMETYNKVMELRY